MSPRRAAATASRSGSTSQTSSPIRPIPARVTATASSDGRPAGGGVPSDRSSFGLSSVAVVLGIFVVLDASDPEATVAGIVAAERSAARPGRLARELCPEAVAQGRERDTVRFVGMGAAGPPRG